MEKQLIVIDDEKAIHSILEHQLPLHGFDVHCCANGKEGLKYIKDLIKTTNIDVILLDWMMPQMSGMEVLAALKENRKTRDIPVFMLTSRNRMDDLDTAYAVGADNYIIKPFKAREIGETIDFKLRRLWEQRNKLAGVSYL